MTSAKQTRLLDALEENSLVKAVLLLELDGSLREQRGQARVIKTNSLDEQQPPKPNENVYMVELSEGVLAVVFDDSVEFERLRRAVDMLVEHAGLAKPEKSK